MKTLLTVIFLSGLLLALQGRAEDANYDSTTRIISFPRVTIDFNDAYTDAQLKLNLDGSYEVLALEPETELNLAGNWSGNSSGISFPDFIPGISCITTVFEASFTQNGDKIIGMGEFVEGCRKGESGNIVGIVNGSNISFDLIMDNEMVINYTGTIASDFHTLTGNYSYLHFDETGTWVLYFQE